MSFIFPSLSSEQKLLSNHLTLPKILCAKWVTFENETLPANKNGNMQLKTFRKTSCIVKLSTDLFRFLVVIASHWTRISQIESSAYCL